MRRDKKPARSPTLETVMMIENFVRDHSGEFTKTQLWKNLPRKVMYQTFSVAFKYLVRLNKILVNPSNNKVMWIFEEQKQVSDLLKKKPKPV